MKKLVSLLVAVVLVYAALCAVLYASQRSLMYFPTPAGNAALAEVLRLDTDGVSLNIWHLPNASDHAIIYFGGNAEDVAWNIDDYSDLFPSADVYLVNYRGYGGSGGFPTEAALFADAVALYDHVRARHSRISVIGRSLGSGVAMHLASVRDVERLVLVTPYDSVLNVAKGYFSMFPVSWMLKDRYDSLGLASLVKAPILILLASHDRVIPRRHSERLMSAFPPSQAEARVIEQTSHDSISTASAYRVALREFLLAPHP